MNPGASKASPGVVTTNSSASSASQNSSDVRKPSGASLLNELVVSGHEFHEGNFIHLTDHRDEYTVLNLHSESDINCTRMHDAIPDETPCHSGVFREGQSESSYGVKCRAGLGIRFFAMREHRIKHDGTANSGKRSRPCAAHAVGYSNAHG